MKSLFPAVVLLPLLIACHYESVQKSEEHKAPVVKTHDGKNRIEFSVDGKAVVTSGWTISRFAYDTAPEQEWLNITTNMKQDGRVLNMNINGVKPGDYVFNERAKTGTDSHGSYFADYLGDMSQSYQFMQGIFTIHTIDLERRTINCSFSGTVRNIKGERIKIDKGSIINGEMNPDVIRY